MVLVTRGGVEPPQVIRMRYGDRRNCPPHPVEHCRSGPGLTDRFMSPTTYISAAD